MKTLEYQQHFSHYKSIGFFQALKGSLTPQSLVESGRNSNKSMHILNQLFWKGYRSKSMTF